MRGCSWEELSSGHLLELSGGCPVPGLMESINGGLKYPQLQEKLGNQANSSAGSAGCLLSKQPSALSSQSLSTRSQGSQITYWFYHIPTKAVSQPASWLFVRTHFLHLARQVLATDEDENKNIVWAGGWHPPGPAGAHRWVVPSPCYPTGWFQENPILCLPQH